MTPVAFPGTCKRFSAEAAGGTRGGAGKDRGFEMGSTAAHSCPGLGRDEPPRVGAGCSRRADAPELDTLVAPVALFPDPLLAAVLQASVVPLDVVQAARFLDDYAKDPTRTPTPTGTRRCSGCSPFRPCSRA